MKKTVLILAVLLVFCGCAVAPPIKEEAPVVFYPPLPQSPKLQFLHAITSEDDLGKTRSTLDQFLLGDIFSGKTIGKAYDIGSSKGKIYVLDRTANKLIFIDLAQKKFDYIRDRRLGTLKDPSGIWVTKEDVKYVADMGRKQIVVFGRDNTFLRAYGGKELFEKPVDVAVYKNSVYVSDMGKSQVFVLNKDTGKLKMTIGGVGSDEGKLYKPTHVIVDHAGNLFVNDAFNFRIQKFDSEGRFVKSYGSLGDALGSFARPKGLDIDKDGHLYVADAAFENVQIFDDKTKQLLLFFGGPGNAPGSMYLPAGVHVDYDNVTYFNQYADRDFKLNYLLYVGNMFGNNKLNVYGFGEWVGRDLTSLETVEASESVERTEPDQPPAVKSAKEVLTLQEDEQYSIQGKKAAQKPLKEPESKGAAKTTEPAEEAKDASIDSKKDPDPASDSEAANIQPKVKKETPETDKRVVLKDSGGSVREKPALNSNVKFNLNKGDTVAVIISRRDWHLVELESGLVGWAHQSLFRDVDNTSKAKNALSSKKEKPGKKAILKVSIGRVRAEPSPSANIKFKLKKGAAPRVIGMQGDWYHVEIEDGRQGWAHKSLFQD